MSKPGRIPLERGWFFGLRFPEPIEAAFRSHYRRVFRGRMRVLWLIGLCVWLVASVLSVVFSPDIYGQQVLILNAGVAILVAATVAASLLSVIDEAIHLTTTVAGVGIGLCTVALFAVVPYPESRTAFIALTVVCVVSTIFVATLHYAHSAAGSLVLVLAFAFVALRAPTVPLSHAVGLIATAALMTVMSLACTNLIEQYARKTFAQQRMLEEQAAAIVEKAELLEVSERRAHDANLAKSVFLSNMSHELRTPLNAVLGFAQLMERDPALSARAREHLNVIQRSGDHLLSLIDDVLAISKIEAGRITLSERAFDLHEMVRSVAEMIRVRTEAKGLQFLVTIDDTAPKAVVGDEGKLRQVLVNLLGNAVKFTEAGGIALRVGSNGSSVTVEIEDTGFGIAPDEVGALFETFGQTESGRRSKEGTGLGLAISRNFVRLMGGDIDVRSELDRGTTFTVKVPLRATSEVTMELVPRRVVGLAPGQPAWRLLVVDDVAENRELLSQLLTIVGFDVREASNGQEAIDQWQCWRPHLIWMDMRMPLVDGHAATERIRSLSADAPCRIIALTASAFHHDRERILADGCDDLVTKPFREATIFDKLAEHLGARFVYDDERNDTDTSGHPPAEAQISDRLLALPADLLTSLKRPMEVGDIEAALEVVGRIREIDELLAVELQRMLRSYQYEAVLDALE